MSRRRCTAETFLLLAALQLTVALFAPAAHAQAPRDAAAIKAEFVHNFLKFVEWPDSAFARPDAPLVVAIVGDGPTADATERLLATKRVGAHPLVVRRMTWDETNAGVHAAFVGEQNAATQRRFLERATAHGILSIGENDGFIQRGGVIGMTIAENRVGFTIGMAAANAAGLRVSARLLALGRVEPR